MREWTFSWTGSPAPEPAESWSASILCVLAVEADWVCVRREGAGTRERVSMYVCVRQSILAPFTVAAGTGGLQWVLSKCRGVKGAPAATTHPLCPPSPPSPENQRVLYELFCSEYQLLPCSLHWPGKQGGQTGQAKSGDTADSAQHGGNVYIYAVCVCVCYLLG